MDLLLAAKGGKVVLFLHLQLPESQVEGLMSIERPVLHTQHLEGVVSEHRKQLSKVLSKRVLLRYLEHTDGRVEVDLTLSDVLVPECLFDGVWQLGPRLDDLVEGGWKPAIDAESGEFVLNSRVHAKNSLWLIADASVVGLTFLALHSKQVRERRLLGVLCHSVVVVHSFLAQDVDVLGGQLTSALVHDVLSKSHLPVSHVLKGILLTDLLVSILIRKLLKELSSLPHEASFGVLLSLKPGGFGIHGLVVHHRRVLALTHKFEFKL